MPICLFCLIHDDQVILEMIKHKAYGKWIYISECRPIMETNLSEEIGGSEGDPTQDSHPCPVLFEELSLVVLGGRLLLFFNLFLMLI